MGGVGSCRAQTEAPCATALFTFSSVWWACLIRLHGHFCSIRGKRKREQQWRQGLLTVEFTRAVGSSVSPSDAAVACFLLHWHWENNQLEKQKTRFPGTWTLTDSVISGFVPAVVQVGWCACTCSCTPTPTVYSAFCSHQPVEGEQSKKGVWSGENTWGPSETNQQIMSAKYTEVKETKDGTRK